MLTRNEMKKYCDMLDKEYAEEIKPMLEKAQKAIDEVISVFTTKEYTDACKRLNSDGVKYGHFSAWQCDLGAFGYYGDSTNNYKMTHYAPSRSMIDLCGYSATAYGDNATLWTLINAADAYRDNDVAALALIKEPPMTRFAPSACSTDPLLIPKKHPAAGIYSRPPSLYPLPPIADTCRITGS